MTRSRRDRSSELDRPLLQGAAFTLVAGPKGVGKGTWLSKTIANVSRGIYGEAMNVLIVSSEDSAAIDVKPRLIAAEADLTRVHSIPDAIMRPADLDRVGALADVFRVMQEAGATLEVSRAPVVVQSVPASDVQGVARRQLESMVGRFKDDEGGSPSTEQER